MQAKFGKWQNMPRMSAEKKALQQELEEDCQSLEYMVRSGPETCLLLSLLFLLACPALPFVAPLLTTTGCRD